MRVRMWFNKFLGNDITLIKKISELYFPSEQGQWSWLWITTIIITIVIMITIIIPIIIRTSTLIYFNNYFVFKSDMSTKSVLRSRSTYPKFRDVSCLVLTNRSTKASSFLPFAPDTCSWCWFLVWSSNRRLSPPDVFPDSIFLSVVSAVQACSLIWTKNCSSLVLVWPIGIEAVVIWKVLLISSSATSIETSISLTPGIDGSIPS